MPLYPRRHDDHYPDDPSPHAEHHIALCGGLVVGHWHRITSGPSEGAWRWGSSLTASAGFHAGGYAQSVEDCRAHLGTAFRRMLERADLRERADAKPGQPRRAPAQASIEPIGALRPYDSDADRRLATMQRNELNRSIRSGELTVGVLTRSTRGPEQWSWSLAGLPRPHDPDFVWNGHADTEGEAFDAFADCWSRWLAWAGLEQVGELRRGSKR